ncbi:hypothetical protein EDD11_005457 [Mortierella claussenii]|nr:hypothetical protein EDD11_005457 [Mortierella claussenii]
MQLHQLQRTLPTRHLPTLDQSPRSTPIPGSFALQQDRSSPVLSSTDLKPYQHQQHYPQKTASDKHYRLLGIQSGEVMPVTTTPTAPSTDTTLENNDIFPGNSNSSSNSRSYIIHNNSSNPNNRNDQFYYNASKSTTARNNSSHSARYLHHQHAIHSSDNNSITHSHSNSLNNSRSRDAFLHNNGADPLMTTDDDTSSTASFRQRSRKLSKAGSVPSPLGGEGGGGAGGASSISVNKNNSSSFSFLSSSDKSHPANSASHSGVMDLSIKIPSQLRVRHLEQRSSYAGYLTKFSSRTFFSRKQWKRRYFILSEKSLYCFKSSDPQHPLLESIELSPEAIICVTDVFSGKRYCLQISCPEQKSWYVLADSASEMSGWLKELKNTVQRTRTSAQLLEARLGMYHYSDESEISDMSGTSTALNARRGGGGGSPSVPTIPSQYDNTTTRSLPLTLSGRQDMQSSYASSLQQQQQQQQPQQHLDVYQSPMTSLNPPPRSITPKPSTPTPGSGPQQRAVGDAPIHSHRASHVPSTQTQQQQQPSSEPMRRRRNSSLSAGQPVSDYASFGTMMQRAEAMEDAQRESSSSSWSKPTKTDRSEATGTYATLPRSKRESTMSTISTMSAQSAQSAQSSLLPSAPLNYSRTSVMTDRMDSTTAPPQRNYQRVTSTVQGSRPTSPASARPLSPSLSRISPRSSLVISPPPRSVHRPTSVSIRHSTQILPPPQIATVGLPSQVSSSTSNSNNTSNNSPITSNPPTSSLPATPDASGNYQQDNPGSLSRITSIRHQRETTGLHRHSTLGVSSSGGTGSTKSLQERVQRSSSRTGLVRTIMASPSSSSPLSTLSGKPVAPMDLMGLSRPLSPTPSLASAPTLPLPEPPRAGSVSPSKSASGSASSTTAAIATATASSSAHHPFSSPSSSEPLRRISSIPRHHEPELPIPNRSKARVRSQSQEAALITARLGEAPLSRRATTPSPRLGAVATTIKTNKDRQSMIVLDSASSMHGKTGEDGSIHTAAHRNQNSSSGSREQHHSRQLSLPIHTMYILPAPPTGQAPSHPLSSTTGSSSTSSPSSRHLMQRSSGSSTALRPISSAMHNVASLGGGVARRPSATHSAATTTSAAAASVASTTSTTLGPSPKRDSVMSTRLSALISLPPGPTTAVPLPPRKSALPAPPTSALPQKPMDANDGKSKEGGKKSGKGRRTNARVGFNMILEEEEEEQDSSREEDEGDEGEDEDEEEGEEDEENDSRVDEEKVDEEDEEDEEDYVVQLQFEELEAARAATEQDQDPDSTVTTPTTVTRPEYYATKERAVVEYIFPSESFAA